MALKNWLVVFSKRDRFKTQMYIQEMKKVCGNINMIIYDPVMIQLANDRTETYLEALRSNINSEVSCGNSPDFLLQ